MLLDHDYPGNIRELENIIEHGFILCSNGQIDVEHLPVSLHRPESAPVAPSPQNTGNILDNAQKETILKALKQTGYHRNAAAQLLGMHKSTLFRKIRKFGIQLPGKDGRHR